MNYLVQEVFEEVVEYGALLLELAGVAIIVFAAVRGIIGYLRGRENVRIHVAEGISLALLFEMGGEVLHTVIVRSWDQLIILGAIIAIRTLLTLLLQWEIRVENGQRPPRDGRQKVEPAKPKLL